MTLAQFADALSRGGIVVLLLAIGWAGAKAEPLWVFGSQMRQTTKRLEDEIVMLRAERDDERAINLRLLGVTEKAITVARQPRIAARKVVPQ